MTIISDKDIAEIQAPLKTELESLRQENRELKQALTSGLCSKHQIPDPLNCKVCNKVEWLASSCAELQQMAQTQQKENSRLREALEFYANPQNYHSIAFVANRPCGSFADDFSEDFGHDLYDKAMPGKLARAALNPPKS